MTLRLPFKKTIKKTEFEIVGGWIQRNGKVLADKNLKRIEFLIENYLQFIVRDSSGWDTLYFDPGTNTFWEKLCPQSEIHGGGPVSLKKFEVDESNPKYDFDMTEYSEWAVL